MHQCVIIYTETQVMFKNLLSFFFTCRVTICFLPHTRQCLSVAHSAVFVAWGAAGVSETIWRCGHKDTGAWYTSGSTHSPLISHEQSGEKSACLGSAAALCSHYIAYVLEHR